MPEPLYLVTFPDTRLGRHVTVRVREIGDSALGIMFVRLAGFQFAATGLVVNPLLEAERERFEGTRVIHVNRMSIISVEEISEVNVAPLPELPDGANVLSFRPPE